MESQIKNKNKRNNLKKGSISIFEVPYLRVVMEADISQMIDVVSSEPDITKCPLAATHVTTSICLTTEQT